jgi:hypothetical protein
MRVMKVETVMLWTGTISEDFMEDLILELCDFMEARHYVEHRGHIIWYNNGPRPCGMPNT